jgi:hypothetical protein
MKAAYEYYKQTAKQTRKTAGKVTLGSLNTGAIARIAAPTKKPIRTSKPKLSAPEQTLMNLINSGQIGALIAFHAPPADLS